MLPFNRTGRKKILKNDRQPLVVSKKMCSFAPDNHNSITKQIVAKKNEQNAKTISPMLSDLDD
jgi:hypothetical protein